MSRSDHPSRPSASTCCFLSSLKTFTSARDHGPYAFVNVLDLAATTGRFSGVPHWPVLGVPRGAESAKSREMRDMSSVTIALTVPAPTIPVVVLGEDDVTLCCGSATIPAD